MKKKISPYAIFILVFLSTADIFSQTGWVQQNSGATNNLSNISFVNDNTGFILFNPFLKTTNGGINWVQVPGLPPVTNISWADALTGYGCNDSLFKTIDGGNSWTNLNQNLFKQVSFINTMTGYATCTPDYISDFAITRLKKTIDGGSTWNSVLEFYVYANPTEWHNFLYIQAVNPQVTYFTINYEEIGWDRWSRVYRTSDGGSNWLISRNSDDSLMFTIFHFPSADTGYVASQPIVGMTYYLFKYINNTWTTVFWSDTRIRGIHFPTNTTGYILTGSYNIFKTTNGGANWYPVNPQTSINLNSIYFSNPSTGYAVGNNGFIAKTTTGGEVPVVHSISGTIRYQDNNDPVTAGYVKALRYDSVSHNIITVDSAQIQSNGAYVLPNCPPVWLDIMAYENDEDALSFVPTYYTSTINWQNATHIKPDSNLSNINVAVKRIINPGDSMHVAGYVYTNNASDYSALKDAIVYTRASGIFKSHSISLMNGYYCVDSLPSGVYELIVDRMGYIGGSFVVTIANSSLNNVNFYLDDILLPVSGVTGELPKDFRLSQNHPNPFNPATSIEFSIPEDSYAKLTIYDVLGREVAVLFDQQLKRGVYRETWNAANYPSGVYFYKLQTEGFTETKKMILIK